MKIVFVYGAYENIGIEYLASCIREKGHEASLVFDPMLFDDSLVDNRLLGKLFKDNQVAERVAQEKPDIIAFSIVTDHYLRIMKTVRAIRKLSSAPILFGGIHPTTVPDRLLKRGDCDYLIVGEGEKAFTSLADILENNQTCSRIDLNHKLSSIKGLWFKNQDGTLQRGGAGELISDLDSLPFPAKDLFFDIHPFLASTYTIMASRGCPYTCTFCVNDIWKKLYEDTKYDNAFCADMSEHKDKNTQRFLRRRSVKNVIDELLWAKRKWNYKSVMFEDDVFTADRSWLRELCDQYKSKIGLPFVCVLHPKNCFEEDLIMLREAGCIQIEIGIQTINSSVRRTALNRFESNREIINALKALHRSKIPFNVDHMAGLPGDTLQHQIDALRLYNEVRPNRLLYFFITCYPSTSITDKCLQAGTAVIDDIKAAEAGRAESDEGCGTVAPQLRHDWEAFRAIFGWLPILPLKLNRWLLKARNNSGLMSAYRCVFLPKNRWFSKIIPSVIAILSGSEPRGRVIMERYLKAGIPILLLRITQIIYILYRDCLKYSRASSTGNTRNTQKNKWTAVSNKSRSTGSRH